MAFQECRQYAAGILTTFVEHRHHAEGIRFAFGSVDQVAVVNAVVSFVLDQDGESIPPSETQCTCG